jgi:hypothetical protein
MHNSPPSKSRSLAVLVTPPEQTSFQGIANHSQSLRTVAARPLCPELSLVLAADQKFRPARLVNGLCLQEPPHIYERPHPHHEPSEPLASLSPGCLPGFVSTKIDRFRKCQFPAHNRRLSGEREFYPVARGRKSACRPTLDGDRQPSEVFPAPLAEGHLGRIKCQDQ